MRQNMGILLEGNFFTPQLSLLRAGNSGSSSSSSAVSLGACCSRCSYVEDAFAHIEKQLATDKQRLSSTKKRRKNTAAAALASNSMVLDDILATENYSFSALLESAYRQPAFEAVSHHSIVQERQSSAMEASSLNMEQLLEPSVIVRSEKRRLDLQTRARLQRTRRERYLNSRFAEEAPSGQSDLWSEEIDMLIREYGSNLNMLAPSWEKLNKRSLTRQEETRLASLMRPAKKLQELKLTLQEHLKREPSEEEWAQAVKLSLRELKRYLQIAQAARNKMVKHNLRLVVYEARKYYREEMSLSLLDLCQEGVHGLMRAVDRFSSGKGSRFSTYACYWVKNAILRAQTRLGHIVRVPYHVAAQKMIIQKERSELTISLDREPTQEEIMQKIGMKEARFHTVMKAGTPRWSLHARCKVTGDELIHNLSDPATEGIDREVLHVVIENLLSSKENLVIRQRYGLDGKGGKSFVEIGRELNLSREMVRKYEIRGLLKLKQRARYIRENIM